MSKLLDEWLAKPKVKYPKITYSNDYYLGMFIGEKIVRNYLLNVSVDLMYNRCIDVTDKEFEEATRLNNDIHLKRYSEDNELYIAKHKIWLEYVKSLERKYLPETIECYIYPMAITINQDIYQGIKDSIWNCDFSNYDVREDLIGQTINEDNPIIIHLSID